MTSGVRYLNGHPLTSLRASFSGGVHFPTCSLYDSVELPTAKVSYVAENLKKTRLVNTKEYKYQQAQLCAEGLTWSNAIASPSAAEKQLPDNIQGTVVLHVPEKLIQVFPFPFLLPVYSASFQNKIRNYLPNAGWTLDAKGSSIIVIILTSVHSVLFFCDPLPPPKSVLWKCWFGITHIKMAVRHKPTFEISPCRCMRTFAKFNCWQMKHN